MITPRPAASMCGAHHRERKAGAVSEMRSVLSQVTEPSKVLKTIEVDHEGADEVSKLDGLLVRYTDWWFNLRPSNTEPVLRLNLEADSPERMAEERDRLLARIEELGGAG